MATLPFTPERRSRFRREPMGSRVAARRSGLTYGRHQRHRATSASRWAYPGGTSAVAISATCSSVSSSGRMTRRSRRASRLQSSMDPTTKQSQPFLVMVTGSISALSAKVEAVQGGGRHHVAFAQISPRGGGYGRPFRRGLPCIFLGFTNAVQTPGGHSATRSRLAPTASRSWISIQRPSTTARGDATAVAAGAFSARCPVNVLSRRRSACGGSLSCPATICRRIA